MPVRRPASPTRGERDIAMMKAPDNWPQWPILPLKRVRGSDLEVGVLVNGAFEGPHTEATVYLSSMNRVITVETPTIKYDSFEALVADGWMID